MISILILAKVWIVIIFIGGIRHFTGWRERNYINAKPDTHNQFIAVKFFKCIGVSINFFILYWLICHK